MNTKTYYYLITPRFTFTKGITVEDIMVCYENQLTDNYDDGETYIPMVNKFLIHSNPFMNVNYVVITIDENGSYLFYIQDNGFNLITKGYGEKLDSNERLNERKIIFKVLRMMHLGNEEIHELGFDKYSRRICSSQNVKSITQYQPLTRLYSKKNSTMY